MQSTQGALMRNQALTELVLGPYKCSSSFWACHARESLRDHCTSWGWAATGLQMKESYLDVNTGDEMWYVDISGKNIADHCPLQNGRVLRQNHYFFTQGSNCCGSRQQQRAEEDLSSATLKCFKRTNVHPWFINRPPPSLTSNKAWTIFSASSGQIWV